MLKKKKKKNPADEAILIQKKNIFHKAHAKDKEQQLLRIAEDLKRERVSGRFYSRRDWKTPLCDLYVLV